MKKYLFLTLLLSLFLVSTCTKGKTQSLEEFDRDAASTCAIRERISAYLYSRARLWNKFSC